MRPTVTTVILFFNKPAMTLRCLTSVEQAENFSAHAIENKTILVDNGSNPESRDAIVSRASDRKIVSLAPNQGFARGMNAGLKEAFADPATNLVVTLCNDVELGEPFYFELAKLAGSAAEPVLWCPEVFFLMDRSKPAYTHGKLDLPTMALSHHFETGQDKIEFPNYYPAAVMAWTRKAFERTQGFNERYFCYWEDVELAHRSAELGVELKSRSTLRAFHLGRGTTGGKSVYSQHFERGRSLTLEIINKCG